MAEEKVLEGEETHIVQVGVVVKDLDKAVEFLTSLGLGPFKIKTGDHPAAEVRGKRASWQSRIAMSKQGALWLELIEFQKGTSIQKEFLDQKGEGIHHLLFRVRDIEATLEKFARKGIHIVQRDWLPGGGGGGYMDPDKTGGIVFEVMQFPPDFDFDNAEFQWGEGRK